VPGADLVDQAEGADRADCDRQCQQGERPDRQLQRRGAERRTDGGRELDIGGGLEREQ
jgi:hypothetical protein